MLIYVVGQTDPDSTEERLMEIQRVTTDIMVSVSIAPTFLYNFRTELWYDNAFIGEISAKSPTSICILNHYKETSYMTCDDPETREEYVRLADEKTKEWLELYKREILAHQLQQ